MQRIKIVAFFLATCVYWSQSFSQDSSMISSSLTLRECVDIAIKNNLLVQQSDLQMQTNKVLFNQAKDNLLPFINITGNQGISLGRSLNPYSYTYVDQQINTGSYSANGNLTLFNGLQIQNNIRQNSFAYAASKLDLQQQKDNITLQVLLAYLVVLSNQELLAISRNQADVDLKQLQRLELQNREGALLLLSNLYDLKGQYAGDLANIVNGVNALESSKVNLFQLLNVPYKRNVEFEKLLIDLQAPDSTNGSDNIYRNALNIIPAVKSGDLKIRASQKALQTTRGQYYPNLSLYANVNSNYSNAATNQIPGAITDVQSSSFVTVGGTTYNVIEKQQNFTTENISFGDQFKNNRFTSVGLQITVPILNSLRARNNVKQAKINLKNAEYNAVNTRLALQQNVELAYQNMISAYGQYKAFIDQVTAFAESFRTTEIRFNEGVVNSDVYVIAKNNIDRANTNMTQAKYIYVLRTKVLDYYRGRLSW